MEISRKIKNENKKKQKSETKIGKQKMKTPEIGNRKRNQKNKKRNGKEKIRNRKSEKRERGRNEKRKSKMGGDSFQGKTYLLLWFSQCRRLQAESQGERKRVSRGEREKESLGERRLLI